MNRRRQPVLWLLLTFIFITHQSYSQKTYIPDDPKPSSCTDALEELDASGLDGSYMEMEELVSDLGFSVDVSPDGSLQGSMPLNLTPIPNGMVPELGISYNSRSGENIMGKGFSLSGFGSIYRGGSKPRFDGKSTPTRFTEEDRLYMGGVRLLAQDGSKSYWEEGQYYYPENSPETKVEVLYSDGNIEGPSGFRVTGVDGNTKLYGERSDARTGGIGAENDQTIMWMLYRVIDREGNFYEHRYGHEFRMRPEMEESYVGELRNPVVEYPLESYYGGHLNDAGLVNIDPVYRVEYNYIDRSDFRVGFMAGTRTGTPKLLTGIQLYFTGGDGIDARQEYMGYDMVYEGGLLREIVRYGYEDRMGGGIENMKEGIVEFRWNEEGFSFEKIDLASQDEGELRVNRVEGNGDSALLERDWEPIVGDFNGDGLDDIIHASGVIPSEEVEVPEWARAAFHSTGTWKVMLNEGDGFSEELETGIVSERFHTGNKGRGVGDGGVRSYQVIDYNNDGYDDLLIHRGIYREIDVEVNGVQLHQWVKTGEELVFLKSDGVGGFEEVRTGLDGENFKAQLFDWNGDGVYEALNTSDQGEDFPMKEGERNYFSLIKLKHLNPTGAAGAMFEEGTIYQVPLNKMVYWLEVMGDVTGDGLVDIFALDEDGPVAYSYNNTRAAININGAIADYSLSPSTRLSDYLSLSNSRNALRRMVDINGDGLSDLLFKELKLPYRFGVDEEGLFHGGVELPNLGNQWFDWGLRLNRSNGIYEEPVKTLEQSGRYTPIAFSGSSDDFFDFLDRIDDPVDERGVYRPFTRQHLHDIFLHDLKWYSPDGDSLRINDSVNVNLGYRPGLRWDYYPYNTSMHGCLVSDWNLDGTSDLLYEGDQLGLSEKEIDLEDDYRRNGSREPWIANGVEGRWWLLKGNGEKLSAEMTNIPFIAKRTINLWDRDHPNAGISLLLNRDKRLRKECVGDWNGDGKPDMAQVEYGRWRWYLNQTDRKTIREVISTSGRSTRIEYASISDPALQGNEIESGDVYSPVLELGVPALGSVRRMDRGTEVVYKIREEYGIENNRHLYHDYRYHYRGFLYDVYRNKSLGVQQFTKLDVDKGRKEVKGYHQLQDYEVELKLYPYAGILRTDQKWVKLENDRGEQEWRITNSMEMKGGELSKKGINNKCYRVRMKEEESTVYDPYKEEVLSLTTKKRKYNEHGHLLEELGKVFGREGMEKEAAVVNKYEEDWQSYYGLPSKVSTMEHVGGEVSSKTLAVEYDEEKLHKTKETRFPDGDASEYLEISYAYDERGNVLTETIKTRGEEERVMEYGYDMWGLHQICATNPLGHTVVKKLDMRWAKDVVVSDANGMKVYHVYDGYGNERYSTDATGKESYMRYGIRPLEEVDGVGKYKKEEYSLGYSHTAEYYDKYGKLIAAKAKTYGGEWIYTRKFYDGFGRETEVIGPFKEGGIAEAGRNKKEYDELDRIVKLETELGTTEYEYEGLLKRIRNGNGHEYEEESNALGHLVRILEPGEWSYRDGQRIWERAETEYSYDVSDNLVEVKDHYGNRIELDYDKLGRKIYQNDPDMGEWYYEYDAHGNIVKQTDGKGEETEMEYDVLDRLIKKTSQEGETHYTYDEGENSLGRLHSTVSTDGIVRETIYNEKGQVSEEKLTVEDNQIYTTSYSYDFRGRQISMSYPGDKEVSYVYDDQGNAIEVWANVEEGGNERNTLLWELKEMDAHGKISYEEYGNGLGTQSGYDTKTGMLAYRKTGFFPAFGRNANASCQDWRYEGETGELAYDGLGNLTNKINGLTQERYSYSYDALNRLGSEVEGRTGEWTERGYSYDAIGNLTKSSVGEEETDCIYGSAEDAGIRPHGVRQMRSRNGGWFGFEVDNFLYDGNGNTIQRGDIDIVYTSFNKLRSVRQRREDNIGREYIWLQSYVYDGEGNRVREKEYELQMLPVSSRLVSDRIIFGGYMLEKRDGEIAGGDNNRQEIQQGGGEAGDREIVWGSQREEWSIRTPGRGMVAQIVKDTDLGGDENNVGLEQESLRYVHIDHLGGTDVLTDEEGRVATEYRYSAWGEQEEVLADGGEEGTRYTYTGQYYDKSLGMYNYGARFYDPKLKRFISPDSVVPDGTNPQNLNRYSYVRNNPINHTDPTGHVPMGMIDPQFAILPQAAAEPRFNHDLPEFAEFEGNPDFEAAVEEATSYKLHTRFDGVGMKERSDAFFEGMNEFFTPFTTEVERTINSFPDRGIKLDIHEGKEPKGNKKAGGYSYQEKVLRLIYTVPLTEKRPSSFIERIAQLALDAGFMAHESLHTKQKFPAPNKEIYYRYEAAGFLAGYLTAKHLEPYFPEAVSLLTRKLIVQKEIHRLWNDTEKQQLPTLWKEEHVIRGTAEFLQSMEYNKKYVDHVHGDHPQVTITYE